MTDSLQRGWKKVVGGGWIVFLILAVGCSGVDQPIEDEGDVGEFENDADDPTKPDDPPFCVDVECGAGTCLESARRCSCEIGYAYNSETRTCEVDACGGGCRTGEFCHAGAGECVAPTCAPDRAVGDFVFCYETTDDGYDVVVRYEGSGTLDLDKSVLRLNGARIRFPDFYDPARQTFMIRKANVEPSKYSYLFRMHLTDGGRVEPLFIPMWIGPGLRYADFSWNDSIVYQIFTDRFLNGDPSNDLDNSSGTLGEISDVRSQWQGGDFAGITQKIRDGYFESMGINTLWISSPVLNSHNSQPGVYPGDTTRYGSYHSYHPIATGHTDMDDFGYPNPIESAFGTPEELHELVRAAHRRGIRIMPDFVPNHVQREANIFARHPGWFFEYNPCHDRWDEARIGCWFTYDMPDFDYGGHPDAVTAVVEHAIWLVHEFNFDSFRLDALKHMDDVFIRALKRAVVERVETTVDNHSKTIEPTIFYMVGESLGGWARYHVRPDMVQGQVDEYYYEH
ncbi:MAG: alpha-amylase family glycosyl hydrolase, partial [Bradymonadaceae bacterium]